MSDDVLDIIARLAGATDGIGQHTDEFNTLKKLLGIQGEDKLEKVDASIRDCVLPSLEGKDTQLVLLLHLFSNLGIAPHCNQGVPARDQGATQDNDHEKDLAQLRAQVAELQKKCQDTAGDTVPERWLGAVGQVQSTLGDIQELNRDIHELQTNISTIQRDANRIITGELCERLGEVIAAFVKRQSGASQDAMEELAVRQQRDIKTRSILVKLLEYMEENMEGCEQVWQTTVGKQLLNTLYRLQQLYTQ